MGLFFPQESTGKTPEEEFAPSELVESPAVAKFKVKHIKLVS